MNRTFLSKLKPDEDRTALIRRRQDLEARRDELEVRKALHREKEAALRDEKRTAAPFLKIDDVQRARVVQKATEDAKQIIEMEHQRCALVVELKTLRLQNARLDRTVQQHAVVTAYVNETALDVKQGPRQFTHRFAALLTNASELLQITESNLECAQNLRSEHAVYFQKAAEVILRGNNAFDELQRDLDNYKTARVDMEEQWSHILDTSAKKTLELGTIKMATINLAKSVQSTKMRGYSPVYHDDTLKQLEQVKDFIIVATDILLDVNTSTKTTTKEE